MTMFSRKWKIFLGLALVASLIGGFFVLTLGTVLLSGYSNVARADSIGGCVEPGTQKSADVIAGTKDAADKIANAKAIDKAAQKAGLSGYASRIAIITAVGESNLVNLDYGDQIHGVKNPDGSPATSFGLFQQQTSQGWGTKAQVMNPEYAATSFFLGPRHDGKSGLVTVPNWETETWISNVIHQVQRNADADHYTKWIPFADSIIKQAGIDISRKATRPSKTTDTSVALDPGNAGCGGAGGGVSVGDLKGKWAYPLPGAILSSGYGPRGTPGGTADMGNFHYGLDYSISGPAVIVAPADIKITKASDVDGGTGAGTHIKAQTIDGALSMGMYHMQPGSLKVKAGQTVAAGTPLAIEGTSGNSTGPHLHIEFFKGAIPDPWAPTSPVVDPCPLFKSKLTAFSCEVGSTAGMNK